MYRKIEEANKPDQMRRAIHMISLDDSLVRSVVDMCNECGISGEDRYVALAYQAIKRYQAAEESLFKAMELRPSPMPMIIPVKEAK